MIFVSTAVYGKSSSNLIKDNIPDSYLSTFRCSIERCNLKMNQEKNDNCT